MVVQAVPTTCVHGAQAPGADLRGVYVAKALGGERD